MRTAPRLGTVLLLSTVLAADRARAASPQGGWQPEVERLEQLLAKLSEGDANASITVEVDAAACANGPVQCDGFPPGPATSNNHNPVRLIVQIVTSRQADDLTPEAFDIRAQFSSADETLVEPLVCPDCFENRQGGTYALWVVPGEGHWAEGSHWVLVRATVDGKILPALARIEIPFQVNEPPHAAVSIFPPGEVQVGQPAVFDGSASQDPDGEITCYQWQLLSDRPAPGMPNPLIVQGAVASSFARTFDSEQELIITLRVSDDIHILCEDVDETHPGGVVEPNERFSPHSFTTDYVIGCRNERPTAVIAGPDVIHAVGHYSTLTSIVLDGTLSFDDETRIDRWVWTCGNDQAPIPAFPWDGPVVICKYRPGTYTATLQVVDRGTGVIDPASGTWKCQRTSDPDTVTIDVVAPQ